MLEEIKSYKPYFIQTVRTKTKTRKDHTCYCCNRIIPSGSESVRHDVWKENNKVTNKYYCSDCEHIIDKQTFLFWDTYKVLFWTEVYNPDENWLLELYPVLFDEYFTNKYPEIKTRIKTIESMERLFWAWYIDMAKFYIFVKLPAKLDKHPKIKNLIFKLRSYFNYDIEFDSKGYYKFVELYSSAQSYESLYSRNA